MSTSDRPEPRNLEQQHKLAKDLLRDARSGDSIARQRIRIHRRDIAEPKLADAQLAIAREGGFESWPKLVAQLGEAELRAFEQAVRKGDLAGLRRLLRSSEHVRKHINDPLFDFGGRAINAAADNLQMLELLMESGADINLRSQWQAGPFSVLDNCDQATARVLLQRGAKLTAHAAARLGWIDELKQIVSVNPEVVHERGGDGQQPLHFAKTPEIADFLVDHGAGIDARCVDHHSTPAQYALAERPDVCRRLLERGAMPDIFMPARLGDVALAAKLIDADPDCLAARINVPGYAPVPPMHIYCWTLGFFLSPLAVAEKYGHRDVCELMRDRSPARLQFFDAAMRGDEAAARAAMQQDPSVLASLSQAEHGHLAQAIFHGNEAAAELMLKLGFDPRAGGVDGGTALHAACWVGSLAMVQKLLAFRAIPIDEPDPTHKSPPLGWAAFGSVQRRAKGADYAGVIRALVAAGARTDIPANLKNRTFVEMATGNPSIQALLRELGAE